MLRLNGMFRSLSFLFIALGLMGGASAQASSITTLNTFSSGQVISSSAMNTNFTNVKAAVNDNATQITTILNRLAALETRVATLETSLASANTQIADLEDQLAAVEDNTVLDLDGYLSLSTHNSKPAALFSGVNVKVVNGMGKTDSVNGLGNFVVGYDEVNTSTSSDYYHCSNGSYEDQTTCQSNSGIWAVSHKSGSHNIIGGSQNSYSQYGGLATGYRNTINELYTSVSGGSNTASGRYASVSGGSGNTASGSYASVSGGNSNTASGHRASVSGGAGNAASSYDTSVSGGGDNIASLNNASVSGGYLNTASGQYASVSGGYLNTASGDRASVSGGYQRSATGQYDWRAGSYFQDQ